MKQLLHSLAVLAFAALFSSCAAMFIGTKQTLQVTSEPSGATIKVNDEVVGTTPCPIELSKSVNEVTLSHAGQEDVTVDLDWNFQFGYLLMDILFTPGYGLVGILVDGGTQSWFKHPGMVHVNFNDGTIAGGVKKAEDQVAGTSGAGTPVEASSSN